MRRLRVQLTAVTDPTTAQVQVSTDDRARSRRTAVLAVAAGRRRQTPLDRPALQRTVIRLTCWHRDTHTAKSLSGIALGLLCAPQPAGALLHGEPVTAPIAGIDPYTAAPLATASLTGYARIPHRA